MNLSVSGLQTPSQAGDVDHRWRAKAPQPKPQAPATAAGTGSIWTDEATWRCERGRPHGAMSDETFALPTRRALLNLRVGTSSKLRHCPFPSPHSGEGLGVGLRRAQPLPQPLSASGEGRNTMLSSRTRRVPSKRKPLNLKMKQYRRPQSIFCLRAIC